MITRNKAQRLDTGPGSRHKRARLLTTLMAVVFAALAFALTGCDATSVNDITNVDTATLQSYLDKLGGKDPRTLTAAEINNLGATLGIDSIGGKTVAEIARASVFYNVNAINNIDMVVPDDQTFEYTVTLKQSSKELTDSYPIIITDSNNQIKSVGMYTSGDVITVSPNDRIAILGIGNSTYTLFQTSHKLANWTYKSLAYTTVGSANTTSLLGGFKVNETATYGANSMSANKVLYTTDKPATSALPVLQTTTDYSTGLKKTVGAWYKVTRLSSYYGTKKGNWDINTWSSLNRATGNTTTTKNSSPYCLMSGDLTVRDVGTYQYKVTGRNSRVKGVQYSKAEYVVTIVATRDDNGQIQTEVSTVMTKDDAGVACNVPVTDNICLFTNGYDPTKATYDIEGVKDYTDNTGATTSYDESFKFTLTPTNTAAKATIPADIQNADGSATVTNDGDVIALPELTFSGFTSSSQTFTYQLHEVDEGVKGMTYDGSYYDITVTASYVANEGYSVDSIKVQKYTAAGKKTGGLIEITTEGYADDPFTFTNTFDMTDDMLGRETISFEKELKGGTAAAGDYTFSVTAADTATENALADGNISGTDVTVKTEGSGEEAFSYGEMADIATASAIADGETVAVSGNELVFNKPGTYTFYVNENGGDDADTTYDAHKATVTFTVTKTADGLSVAKSVDNGTFINTIGDVDETVEPASASVSVPKHNDGAEHTYTAVDSDGNALTVTFDADGNPTVATEYDAAGTYTYTISDETGNAVTVTVTVTADPTTGALTATSSFSPEEGFAAYDEKTDEGKTSTISVPGRTDGKDHTYTAVDEDGKDVPVTVDENGNVTFDQTFTPADAGEHVYKVTDDEGNVVTVTVTVGDDGSVRLTLTDPGDGFASFDNADEPKSVEESVTIAKRDDGEEHTYTAVDEDGKAVEVTTDADGNPVVNKTYTADDAGDHTIVVTDDDGNKVTITTIVTVDDDGNITVVSTTDPADGFATFDEKADEGKTSTISVAGHDDGKNHTYTAVDENGKDVPVTVDENGNVTFDQTYTAADAGDHVYKITDDEGNVVTVTVTVGDDGSVRMTLTDPCEGFAAFDADDEPKSVEESVTIAKRADGEDHTYTAVDENGATVEVKTDADGNPVVDKTYTADDAGTHTVVVTDDDGNKVTITTVVTVDADGTVTATSTTDPADGFATFDEKTDETKTATITVPDRSDGEDHTYTAEDENGNPVDVTVDENGNVTFNQDFGPDDAGDHTYTVTDDDGNTVTVTVSVDDKGDVTLTLTDPADGFASFDEEEDAKTRHHLRRWA